MVHCCCGAVLGNKKQPLVNTQPLGRICECQENEARFERFHATGLYLPGVPEQGKTIGTENTNDCQALEVGEEMGRLSKVCVYTRTHAHRLAPGAQADC